jgi:superfamily II DNA or RNA helicase
MGSVTALAGAPGAAGAAQAGRSQKIHLPRFGIKLLASRINLEHHNAIALRAPLDLKYMGTLKPNQQIICDYLLRCHFNPQRVERIESGVTLNMQTGHGKSFVAMYLIGALKCRTLIITHNKNILQQWEELIAKYFPGAELGTYHGTKKKFGDITIGVINSMVADTFKFGAKDAYALSVFGAAFTGGAVLGGARPAPAQKVGQKVAQGVEVLPRAFYDAFDFIIFDESHEYCSNMRNKIFRVCQVPYMLGLSATPNEREDGLTKVCLWNIGPVLDVTKLPGYSSTDVNFTGKVVRVNYYGPSEYTQIVMNKTIDVVSVQALLEQITADPQRTQMVVDLILEFHQQNYNIFVFADRREYLQKIDSALRQINLRAAIVTTDEEMRALDAAVLSTLLMPDAAADAPINGPDQAPINGPDQAGNSIKSMCLLGGSKAQDMNLAKAEKNIILSTYAYMVTGTSIPKMNCMIMTTPRKTKIRQAVGRVFRLGSDESVTRIIVDIVDMKIPIKSQYYERKKYYDSQNFEIVERKVKA